MAKERRNALSAAMRPLEIRSGGRSPPDPDINAVSGQGDVLLQILLRQLVPGVVTQGPGRKPRFSPSRRFLSDDYRCNSGFLKRIAYTTMPYKTGLRLLGVARNPANGFPARPLGERS